MHKCYLFDERQQKDLPSLNNYDAIVIPGAGGPRDGQQIIESLPVWITAKLDACVSLVSSDKQTNLASPSPSLETPIVLLSAGTYHKTPVKDVNGRDVHESTAMSLYLQQKMLNPKFIYEENTSYDTVGNAYFLRAVHTDVREWHRLLVIVNEFHYPRLSLIFDWIFKLKNNSGTPAAVYQIDYLIYPDKSLPIEIESQIKHRIIRERASYESMQKRINDSNVNITSFKEFHQWMFETHDNYRSSNKTNLVLKQIKTLDCSELMETY